ncbi:MAG: hypothetical protein ABIN01_25305 [Ferruginibacter sp.]
MKLIRLVVFLLAAYSSFSQIKLNKLNTNSIPKGIKYIGQIKNAVQWMDSLGNNIVITTETGEIATNSKDESRDAALYALHYVVNGDSLNLICKLYDFVKECPVDIKASYIKNTFAVTDLNKNGKAEVWLMYKTVCHGDVSPSNMKIIMFEAGKKHAVRGTNKVKVSEKDFMGGEYNFDEAFKKAPEVFRQYANQLWAKNIMETWE